MNEQSKSTFDDIVFVTVHGDYHKLIEVFGFLDDYLEAPVWEVDRGRLFTLQGGEFSSRPYREALRGGRNREETHTYAFADHVLATKFRLAFG